MQSTKRKGLTTNLKTAWIKEALGHVSDPRGKLTSLVMSSPETRERLQAMQRDNGIGHNYASGASETWQDGVSI